MTALNTRPVPVQRSRTSDIIVGSDVRLPMAQQSTLGSHGHDMHPQEFVRLSGCQQQRLPKQESVPLPH